MINEITLIGFKSFLHRIIKLNRLTILTGLNSSGKSSIIQALLMLEKAKNNEKSILLDGLGSAEEIRNIYHNQEISLSISDDSNKTFSIKINYNSGLDPYSCEELQGFEFPEIIHISANRFGPKTSIPIFYDKKNRIGPNGENLFQFIESYAYMPLQESIIHPESEGETVEYNIAAWLSVISPNIKFRYVIDKHSDTSYAIFNEHRATNVGYGLSYSLSVISALLIGTLIPNCIVAIENPEAHLHPKGQTEMAKLISLCSQAGLQILIETHSDHIFDGIRVFAKENKGFAENVQIHWFELDNSQNTDVISPTLDEDGRLDDWPTGLFDQFEINASKLI